MGSTVTGLNVFVPRLGGRVRLRTPTRDPVGLDLRIVLRVGPPLLMMLEEAAVRKREGPRVTERLGAFGLCDRIRHMSERCQTEVTLVVFACAASVAKVRTYCGIALSCATPFLQCPRRLPRSILLCHDGSSHL